MRTYSKLFHLRLVASFIFSLLVSNSWGASLERIDERERKIEDTRYYRWVSQYTPETLN
jgi:hypothetical protein